MARPLMLLMILLSGCSANGNMNGDCAGGDPALYACGPYGFGPGGVIQNLSFTGRSDSNGSGVTDVGDAATTLSLDRYYKNKSLKALVILGVAEWCVPCRDEQPDLVALVKSYGGQVAVLEAVLQDAKSKPADQATADRWASDFKVPFDLAFDPAPVLQPFFDGNFPFSMVILPKTMTIAVQTSGLDLTLKAHIDGVIASN